MAVQCEKGTFTKRSGTGSQTVTLVDSSITPKALWLWSSGVTTANAYAENYLFAYGFSDGTNDACIGGVAVDNGADSTTAGTIRDDSVIAIFNTNTTNPNVATLAAKADVTSFNAGNFILNWSTAGTAAEIIHYMVVGGSDITNVKVVSAAVGVNVSGNASYTGVGFQGDFINLLGAVNVSVNTELAVWHLSNGAATSSSAQFQHSTHTEHDASSSDTGTTFSTVDVMQVLRGTSTVTDGSARFVSFGSDGYTLNWIDNPNTTTQRLAALVIKGGVWNVGNGTAPATATSQNISTTASTDVKGVMMFTPGLTSAPGENAMAVQSRFNIGGADSALHEGSISMHDLDAQSTMVNTRYSSDTKIIRSHTAAATATSSTTNAEADISSMATQGQFSISWTTTLSGMVYGWFAISQGAATTSVSQDNIHKYNLRHNVAPTTIQKYNMRQYIPQTNIHKYNLRMFLSQASIHKYNISTVLAVLQTSIQKYNLRKYLTQTTIHKYNLRHFISQTNIHKYNLKKLIAQTLIQKYHLSFYDTFDAGTYSFTEGGASPNGRWTNQYLGGTGATSGVRFSASAGSNVMWQKPQVSTAQFETHATFNTSPLHWGNFDMTIRQRTVSQLRQNFTPNAWECAWILFRYTDDWHHYYFTLKTSGIELGRKDYATPQEQQIFLFTNTTPTLTVGNWDTVRIKATGNHFDIWINGTQVVNYTDDGTTGFDTATSGLPAPPSTAMYQGRFGLYNEDAEVEFDYALISGLGSTIAATIHKYKIIQQILATTIHKYRMAGMVLAASIQKYNLRKYLAQTTIQKYNLRRNIAQTIIHKYNLRAAIIQTSIHKYKMSGIVLATTIQKYNLRKYIPQTNIHKYNLRIFVAITTSIQKYNLRKFILQTNIHKYNMRQYITQASIHKYSLGIISMVDMTITNVKTYANKFITKT